MAILPWGWISVPIPVHPLGPERKLRSPFCDNTNFVSSQRIPLSMTALQSKIQGVRQLEIIGSNASVVTQGNDDKGLAMVVLIPIEGH